MSETGLTGVAQDAVIHHPVLLSTLHVTALTQIRLANSNQMSFGKHFTRVARAQRNLNMDVGAELSVM